MKSMKKILFALVLLAATQIMPHWHGGYYGGWGWGGPRYYGGFGWGGRPYYGGYYGPGYYDGVGLLGFGLGTAIAASDRPKSNAEVIGQQIRDAKKERERAYKHGEDRRVQDLDRQIDKLQDSLTARG